MSARSFVSCNDNRMFVWTRPDREGVCVVIIDDFAQAVANGDIGDADTRFIREMVARMRKSSVVGTIILADFEFQSSWIRSYAEPASCVYFVDVFAGDNKEARGIAIVRSLEKIVRAEQVALFTKAKDTELRDLFGAGHPYRLSKGIDQNGVELDNARMVALIIADGIEFVEQACKSVYLQSVVHWSKICKELHNWRSQGLFFPVGLTHDAKWWVAHGNATHNSDKLAYGRARLQELTGATHVLSHKAVFSGLKAISRGLLSVRLLCEIGGVAPEILDGANIVLQVLTPAGDVSDAEALLGLQILVSTSPGTPWSLSVKHVERLDLVIVGSTRMNSSDAAARAVEVLSQPLAKNESPHNGRTALDKVRRRSRSLSLSCVGDEVHLEATFSLYADGLD